MTTAKLPSGAFVVAILNSEKMGLSYAASLAPAVLRAWLVGVAIVMAVVRDRWADVVSGDVTLEGEVYEIVDQRGIQQSVRLKTGPGRETIQVHMNGYPIVRIGDRIAIACELEGVQGLRVDGFRYDRYLMKERVLALCRTYASPLIVGTTPSWRTKLFISRDRMERALQRSLHEPHASLLIGLLYGARSTLPDNIQEEFRRSGTMHIVAVSGYNVMLVSIALMLPLSIVMRRQYSLTIVLFCIGGFVVLAGGDAAVVRAAVMGSLVLVARHIGRPSSSPALLLLAATVMTMIEPRLLLDDAGFHLSFAAAAGLIWLAPYIRARLKGFPRRVQGILSETTAATIMTAPILWLQFGQMSLVAPWSNLFVLPLIPYAVGSGLFAMIGSVIAQTLSLDWLGVALAMPAYVILDLMLMLIHLFAALPWIST